MKKLVVLLFALSLFPCIGLSERIIDLFPDANVARFVRDEVGAFDVTDEVTQEQLDKIWLFGNLDGYGEIYSVDGISNLKGATMLRLQHHWQSDVLIKELPDELTTMNWVTSLELSSLYDLKALPDNIGDMTALKSLDIENCGIEELPDSICDLEKLETLNLSGCPLSRLPDNIGNLKNLKRLDISDTNIKELPESIRELKLESFKRSGTGL